jgi:hypothetical protein
MFWKTIQDVLAILFRMYWQYIPGCFSPRFSFAAGPQQLSGPASIVLTKSSPFRILA